MATSRKRSLQQTSDVETEVTEETTKVESTTEKTPPAAKSKKQKKESKDKGSSASDESNKKSKKPLNGMTVSVSTLSDNTQKETSNESASYNDVCSLCKELGANVIDLVCKRTQLLVCSEAAIKQATQRVRKAIKKGKPVVSVAWLDKCKEEGRKVDTKKFRLDERAKEAIQKREDRLETAVEAAKENEDGLEDIPDDAGWTEPQDLGCCCVCHENGTTADCPWCVDCPANHNRASAKK